MTPQQISAISHHCRFAFETCQFRFGERRGKYTVLLTVNSGYE